MKNTILFLILVLISITNIYGADSKNPVNPKDPTVKGDSILQTNIYYQKQNGKYYNGYSEAFKSFYLEGLSWAGNEDGSQKVLIDLVSTIRIKGYKKATKTTKNLTLVYYMPYIFDIKLKDGTDIRDAQGTIKEIDSFELFTNYGKEKCYTYFGRYWLEDDKKFQDNKSTNFDESPKTPDNVVIYIKFNS